MELTVAGKTDIGPRSTNEDRFGWWPELGLVVVADGMGGHNAGEVASQLAVDVIHGFIAESAASPEITWPFGIELANSLDVNRLTTAVRLANRQIFAEGSRHPELSGMGTTVVAALVTGARVAIVSVGDSRVYRWRGGQLEQLTQDDTWLATVLGLKAAEVAESSHPLRHVLTSVVGTRDDLKPSTRDEPLESGDTFLLCTDGVHGRLDAETLALVMGASATPADQAGGVVQEAVARRTSDNATAVVVTLS